MDVNSYSFHTSEVKTHVYAFYKERGLKKNNPITTFTVPLSQFSFATKWKWG